MSETRPFLSEACTVYHHTTEKTASIRYFLSEGRQPKWKAFHFECFVDGHCYLFSLVFHTPDEVLAPFFQLNVAVRWPAFAMYFRPIETARGKRDNTRGEGIKLNTRDISRYNLVRSRRQRERRASFNSGLPESQKDPMGFPWALSVSQANSAQWQDPKSLGR